MTKTIYLDYHATTPVDPAVLEAMLPYFGPKFGNAASGTHSFGWEAEAAVEAARRRIAELAGAGPREIVFTSGATESDNLALKGVVAAAGAPHPHIVTVATEHKAVLDTAATLEAAGCRVTVLRPRPDGLLDLDELRDAIVAETLLVSVMYANNEIGVLQPVAEIGAICREKNVLFHCDAVQAFGKFPVHVDACRIDLMSMSAHKMYGPKGVGALYVRRRNPRVRLDRADGWRRPRRRDALRHLERARHRRASARHAPSPRRDMAAEYPRIAPCATACCASCATGSTAAHSRLHGAPPGRQPEREFRRRRWRRSAGGRARRGRLHGQRLQFPWGRRQPRAARHRRARCDAAIGHALRTGAVHHAARKWITRRSASCRWCAGCASKCRHEARAGVLLASAALLRAQRKAPVDEEPEPDPG